LRAGPARVIQSAAYLPYSQRYSPRFDTESVDHGLGVASKAAGRYLGVNQFANLIVTELQSPEDTVSSQDRLMAAYQEVFDDMENLGRLGQGMSVIVTGMFLVILFMCLCSDRF
jgi:hypothetical protein